MFSGHVTENISAYCHGELNHEEAREFSEHILSCAKCRAQFEEIKSGVKFAEKLTILQAPENLWRELDAKLQSSIQSSSPAGSLTRSWQLRAAAIAAMLLTVTLVSIWLVSRQSSVPNAGGWEVRRISGTPRIGSRGIQKDGQLSLGQWLETDDHSSAQIEVGSIGQVEIQSNTRVRLLQMQPTDHRLELVRGKMSARIWAPPRLFFVDTPSAVAADLGCAYTLEVDDSGASLLRVTSGWVALELKDRESMVPAGAACQTRPGIGPGTPYFEDASMEFRQALTLIDFQPDHPSHQAAMDLMLRQTRQRDTLTLWHLLSRVDPQDRVKLFEKIESFVPLPEGVTREGILRLDPTMLELWRDKIKPTWSRQISVPTEIADTYWRVKNGIQRRVKELKP